MRPTRALLLLACPLLAACDGGVQVELTTPERGPLRASFREPARTRLAHTYTVSMPLDGRLGRIALDPGDRVEEGQELAAFDRVPLAEAAAEARAAVEELQARIGVKGDDSLAQTAREEIEHTIQAGEETLQAADAQVEAARARATRAQREEERVERLHAEGAVPRNRLDDARLLAETSTIELRREQFIRTSLDTLLVALRLGPRFIDEYVDRKELEQDVLRHQLAQARARLTRAEHQLELARVRSPLDGVVLERLEDGGRALPAGHDLLRLGRLEDMEVVCEVLTSDALQLEPGGDVHLEPAAGLDPLAGSVERVEPAGFTKLSSLGVEQQRVNVIVSLEDDRPAGLGAGYRLQARFFTGTAEDALIVKRWSVLQAPDRSRYVFVVEDGRLVRRPVELGLRGDLEVEVVGGLDEDDRIVATPDASLSEGDPVAVVP